FGPCIFSQERQPYIGYVYPAGGQAGTTFTVTIGGQNLRGTNKVYFSTEKISSTIINYNGPSGPLNALQIEELRRILQEIRDKRSGRKTSEDTRTETEKKVKLPDIPELRNLESKTPKELNFIYEKYLNRQNKPKPPIAEEIQIQITIDPDAKPGDYEMWLKTPNGLTNPVMFQVGKFPEFCCTYNQYRFENENIERDTHILETPVTINGRILPGKTNRFTLKLFKGQNIVILAQARKLIPYLADGVPGWFQAIVALYDENWKELAYADDYYFNPDPVLKFRVPETGIYFLEIRDSIYRGREDFVYRIYVMEEKDALLLFPLLFDHNSIMENSLSRLPETVKSLPQYRESEHSMHFEQYISIPALVKGCINYPGDIDRYRFYGRQKDVIVLEIYGRRLGLPIDPLIRLKNQYDQIIEWNDDMKQDFEHDLLTHHADPFMMVRLPTTGNYTVEITDAQGHGGDEYGYFLRLSKPMPDFQIMVSPSRINVPADGFAVLKTYAIRKDGWDGDIEIAIKNCPTGIELGGNIIPAGRNIVQMTLYVPARYMGQSMPLEIEGKAIIAGREVIRQAKVADEKMQAFAYTHLVPSENLIVSVIRQKFRQIKPNIPQTDTLKIPAGGFTTIKCETERWFRPGLTTSLWFDLKNPPEGIKIKEIYFDSGYYNLTIMADEKIAGYKDNLIIEIFEEISLQQGKRKTPAGFLPAIPFEVVKND
ncbi:MAG: hypothetical protein NC906_05670, partial [Candidatus Omnitrophica bacterium]|nr:hypothetical protein [Candidatus Omnitrophota bacterium]